jgi:hypothetical protein
MPVQVFHYSLMLLLAFATSHRFRRRRGACFGDAGHSGSGGVSSPTAWDHANSSAVSEWLRAAQVRSSPLLLATAHRPFLGAGGALVFAIGFFFGPRHGIVSRWWRQRSRSAQFPAKHVKAIYHVLEDEEFAIDQVSAQLAERRREASKTFTGSQHARRHQSRHALVRWRLSLSPQQWRVPEIARNHRLWELYLTNAAHRGRSRMKTPRRSSTFLEKRFACWKSASTMRGAILMVG